MISADKFLNELNKNDLNFFSGVPDSLLKDLSFEIEAKFQSRHYIAANEGSAVGIGIGYHLRTKKIPVIYMQNSGLGNAINPLISLANTKVYQIPLFLIVGWRGEISKNYLDEPQHITQGKETKNFLKNLGIKYKIIDSKSDIKKIIKFLKRYSHKHKLPVCILVKKNTFKKKQIIQKSNKNHLFLREELLKIIVKKLPNNSTIVSTTGLVSRELNEIIKKKKKKLNLFMCVGGMGHAISIASGLASQTRKKVYCFDGDGALTMHMGSMTTSALQNNIVHILFNNNSHESVGGQKTSSEHIKFYKLAKNVGYNFTKICKRTEELNKAILQAKKSKKSFFIEVLCKKGHRINISRPKERMHILKEKFIKNLVKKK